MDWDVFHWNMAPGTPKAPIGLRKSQMFHHLLHLSPNCLFHNTSNVIVWGHVTYHNNISNSDFWQLKNSYSDPGSRAFASSKTCKPSGQDANPTSPGNQTFAISSKMHFGTDHGNLSCVNLVWCSPLWRDLTFPQAYYSFFFQASASKKCVLEENEFKFPWTLTLSFAIRG